MPSFPHNLSSYSHNLFPIFQQPSDGHVQQWSESELLVDASRCRCTTGHIGVDDRVPARHSTGERLDPVISSLRAEKRINVQKKVAPKRVGLSLTIIFHR